MLKEGSSTFETTPSWVIGAVVFVIITISWVIRKLLKHLGSVILKVNGKKPLYEALMTIEEELMLMGFVSLLLALVQDQANKWCIPVNLSLKWLPCHTTNSSRGRHLNEGGVIINSMCKEGRVPLLSLTVLHELHYLIFILTLAHAITCTITVLLGEAKIRRWRTWEESIRNNIDVDNDRSRKVTRTSSHPLVKDRVDGVDANKRYYVYSIFKYLRGVVTKDDYEAMRTGFILAYCNGDQRFNFHGYLLYAYEADFKKVVSIGWYLWIIAVICLSLNIAGWNIYFWFSSITLFLLLVVGVKLEKVITDLVADVCRRHTAIVGVIQIKLSDDYFWFKKPRIMLLAIHATLFMNSFGFAIFLWTLLKFKPGSCIMGDPKLVIARFAIMLAVQFFCSFSSLPLYAIVTQMGSSVNKEGMSLYSVASTDSNTITDVHIAAVT